MASYMVSRAGNHVVENYPSLEEAAILREVLGKANLLDKDNEQVRIWDRSCSLYGIYPKTRASPSFSVDPTGMPSVGASIEFGVEVLHKIDLAQFDWYDLLGVVHNAFSKLHRGCWIIFDRLDEAFPENRALETSALRALLRTHLDLSSSGKRVHSKLFCERIC